MKPWLNSLPTSKLPHLLGSNYSNIPLEVFSTVQDHEDGEQHYIIQDAFHLSLHDV